MSGQDHLTDPLRPGCVLPALSPHGSSRWTWEPLWASQDKIPQRMVVCVHVLCPVWLALSCCLHSPPPRCGPHGTSVDRMAVVTLQLFGLGSVFEDLAVPLSILHDSRPCDPPCRLCCRWAPGAAGWS